MDSPPRPRNSPSTSALNFLVVVGSLKVKILDISDADDLLRSDESYSLDASSSLTEKSDAEGNRRAGIMDRIRARMSSKKESETAGVKRSTDSCSSMQTRSGMDAASARIVDGSGAQSSKEGFTYASLSIINPTLRSPRNQKERNNGTDDGLVVGPSFKSLPVHLWTSGNRGRQCFVFDHVRSECLLFVGMYAHTTKADNPCSTEDNVDNICNSEKYAGMSRLVGYARIPLRRLEEDVVRSQWYSLSPVHDNAGNHAEDPKAAPISPSGPSLLRTAVQLELQYSRTHDTNSDNKSGAESTSANLSSSAFPLSVDDFNPLSRSRSSSVDFKEAKHADRGIDNGNSDAKNPNYDLEYFERKRTYTSNFDTSSKGREDSEKARSVAEIQPDIDMGAPQNLKAAGSTEVIPGNVGIEMDGMEQKGEEDDGLYEGGGACGVPGSMQYAVLQGDYYSDSSTDDQDNDFSGNDGSNVEDDEKTKDVEFQKEEDMNLPVGLVDYVLLFSPPISNTGGDNSKGNMNEPVVLRSRFPPQNHADSPLPDGVEWFAAPRGCVFQTSAASVRSGSNRHRYEHGLSLRPAPSIACFVLSSAGGTWGQEQYGVTLTFYVPAPEFCTTSVDEDYSNYRNETVEPEIDITAGGGMWLSDTGPEMDTWGSKRNTYKGKKNRRNRCPLQYHWMGVHLCLISRFPFFQQMSQLLEAVYVRHHLYRIKYPKLQHPQILRNHHEAVEDSADVKDNDPGEMLRGVEALALLLCLQLPVPVAYSVSVTLPPLPLTYLPSERKRESDEDKAREEGTHAISDPESENMYYIRRADQLMERSEQESVQNGGLGECDRQQEMPLFSPTSSDFDAPNEQESKETVSVDHRDYGGGQGSDSTSSSTGRDGEIDEITNESDGDESGDSLISGTSEGSTDCGTVESTVATSNTGESFELFITKDPQQAIKDNHKLEEPKPEEDFAKEEDGNEKKSNKNEKDDNDRKGQQEKRKKGEKQRKQPIVIRTVNRNTLVQDVPVYKRQSKLRQHHLELNTNNSFPASSSNSAAGGMSRKESVLGSWLASELSGGSSGSGTVSTDDREVSPSVLMKDEEGNETDDGTETDSNTDNDSNAPSVDLRDLDPSPTLVFAQPDSSDLPRCPFSVSAVVRQLSPKVMVDVLAAVFSESKILFLSADMGMLPAVCEVVRTLLYPLQWSHVYVPVVRAIYSVDRAVLAWGGRFIPT